MSERAAMSSLPAVAIGGIGEADMAPLGQSHIDGAAVVSAICCAPDAEAASRTLLEQWQRGRALKNHSDRSQEDAQ